ncbi:MAG: serine/threonine protein phosphatase [Oscillospiraceae bacterium]|jgi:hypothetical protein|nr:serine/threonine protein phosphatase [Oscillospiraceae bacterium]
MANSSAGWRKRKRAGGSAQAAAPLALAARGNPQPFPMLAGQSGAAAGFCGEMEHCCPAAEARLYYSLREAVPLIDAAVFHLVRLVGGFRVGCADARAERWLAETLALLPAGGNQRGIHAFVATYFEQLLTLGTALGELVLREDGSPAALWNAPPEGVTLCRAANGLDVEICTGEPEQLRPVPHPQLVYLSVLNPLPGALAGNSLLKGLPFVSGVLLQILHTLGQNWERLGNVRFAVTYQPGSDPAERLHTRERVQELATQWEAAMQEGAGVRDFIAAGDVSIRVIGAEAPLPESEIPIRQLLEQIVAKTGLPPFLLGLTWSSTERMSAQQADLLTSELESYRRILTPVILRISQTMLAAQGYAAPCTVVWDDITLADEVELARAELLRAQAAKIKEGTGG